VKTMNAAANKILAVEQGAFHGLKLPDWPRHVQAVAPFAEIALRHFGAASDKQWEEQMEYRRADGPRTLLMRGTRLGTRGEPGYVLVFDDITHLIQAQRDAAWARSRGASRTRSRIRSRRSSCRQSACSTSFTTSFPKSRPTSSSARP